MLFLVFDNAQDFLTHHGSARLVNSISSFIRQQHRLRISTVISTQEPSAIPTPLIDLCSFIICHRFSSPRWFWHLNPHLPIGHQTGGGADGSKESADLSWYDEVLQLKTGQALLFSSGAVILTMPEEEVALLGAGYMLIKTRPRATMDRRGSAVNAKEPMAILNMAEESGDVRREVKSSDTQEQMIGGSSMDDTSLLASSSRKPNPD